MMSTSKYDVSAVRREFPILSREVNGRPLAYLDSAATSQTPRCVIDAITDYYERYNANVHRGLHKLSEESTAAFEGARETVARYIGADAQEIIFTGNATEALNLAAQGWAMTHLRPGDSILLTEMEHHANLVPWQVVAQRTGSHLRFIPIDEEGRLDMDEARRLISDRPRILAFPHASNVLGTINPVAELVSLARDIGAVVVVDGAQAAPHLPLDMKELGADFYAFSAHKMCGPTGVGVLYGRFDRLEETSPILFGGSMISRVRWEDSDWNIPPHCFEAGTPNIEGVIAFAAAIRFLESIGDYRTYEDLLVPYGLSLFERMPGVRLIGPTTPEDRLGVFSFTVDGVHPHDVSQVADELGVAIRAGHHCCEPLHKKLGLHGTARASVYLYTTTQELDTLAEAMDRVRQVFAVAT